MNPSTVRLVSVAAMIIIVPQVVKRFTVWRAENSKTAAENVQFKARLPGWVKLVELLALLVSWFIIALVLFAVPKGLHALLHSDEPFSTNAFSLIALQAFFLGIPLAALAANVFSEAVPAMREANKKAAEGLPSTEYDKLNRGLRILIFWILPIFLGIAILGVIDPWLNR